MPLARSRSSTTETTAIKQSTPAARCVGNEIEHSDRQRVPADVSVLALKVVLITIAICSSCAPARVLDAVVSASSCSCCGAEPEIGRSSTARLIGRRSFLLDSPKTGSPCADSARTSDLAITTLRIEATPFNVRTKKSWASPPSAHERRGGTCRLPV